jgi:hypothetical protein
MGTGAGEEWAVRLHQRRPAVDAAQRPLMAKAREIERFRVRGRDPDEGHEGHEGNEGNEGNGDGRGAPHRGTTSFSTSSAPTRSR